MKAHGGEANRAKTHCAQGHPLSGDNLYVWKNCRQCRTCKRAATRRCKAKKKRVSAGLGGAI